MIHTVRAEAFLLCKTVDAALRRVTKMGGNFEGGFLGGSPNLTAFQVPENLIKMFEKPVRHSKQ